MLNIMLILDVKMKHQFRYKNVVASNTPEKVKQYPETYYEADQFVDPNHEFDMKYKEFKDRLQLHKV